MHEKRCALVGVQCSAACQVTDCYRAALTASRSMTQSYQKSGQLIPQFQPDASSACKEKIGVLLHAIFVEVWLVASIESLWEARQHHGIIERLDTCNLHVT